jgi:hypothetical protein
MKQGNCDMAKKCTYRIKYSDTSVVKEHNFLALAVSSIEHHVQATSLTHSEWEDTNDPGVQRRLYWRSFADYQADKDGSLAAAELTRHLTTPTPT